MTEELFREDAALDTCDARITILGEAGIELDRTVFYPQGGGQAGDRGEMRMADGRVLAIADTKKGATAGAIVHLPAPGQEALLATLSVDMPVRAAIDRARRSRHMRFHTATRPAPRAHSRDRQCRLAALRRHACRKYCRHQARRRHEDREEVGNHTPRGARPSRLSQGAARRRQAA